MNSNFAILIVNWNSHMDIQKILDVTPTHIPFVIVDNNSERIEELTEILSQFKNVALIRSSVNGGYGYGMNLAISYVKSNNISENILLLNPDVRLSKEFISHVETSCDCFDVLGFQQYTIGPSGEKNFYPCAAYFVKGKIRLASRKIEGRQLVDIVTGAALLFKVSAFDGIGMFDESFFHYKEEFDLCFRMTTAGRTVAIDYEVPLHHEAGSSLAHDSSSAIYYRVRNEILFARKHRTISILRSAQNIGAVIKDCLSSQIPGKFRIISAAIKDGCIGKNGIRGN